jgi:hypothetical protein
MVMTRQSKAPRAGAPRGSRAKPEVRRPGKAKTLSPPAEVPWDVYKATVEELKRKIEELENLDELTEEQLQELQKLMADLKKVFETFAEFIKMAEMLMEAIQQGLENIINGLEKAQPTRSGRTIAKRPAAASLPATTRRSRSSKR